MTRRRTRHTSNGAGTLGARLCAAVVLGLAAGASAQVSAQSSEVSAQVKETVLTRALGDELKRTMTELRLAEAQRPYFVAYRVVESATTRATASMGGAVDQWQGRNRRLLVELRVGSAALDNTNFFDGRRTFGAPSTALPLDDDYEELRRRIWLATDRAYKDALDDFAGKQAALQNKTKTEEVADLSAAEPFQATDRQPRLALDAARAVALAKDISSAFEGKAHIHRSEVGVGARQTTVTYLNSEGSFFVRNHPLAHVHVSANTQGEDGTELGDFVAAEARAWEQLPSQEELAARVARMIAGLAELRAAPPMERYTGPVLFEGQAAAELVAQVLAPRFVGLRMPVADNPMFERAMEQVRNPFLDKLGARVLARSLSVVDDPTASADDGTALLGSYVVDDDGVRATPTALVQNGILKTLLTSRNPLPELPTSSGNRRGQTALPSNLLITAKNGLDDAELRAELLALVEERGVEHGIVVRRIGSPRMATAAAFSVMAIGQGPKVLPLTLAYKVFPDGREELVGKAILPTFTEAQFKEVVAASQARTRYDTSVSPVGGGALFGGGFAIGAGGGALTTIVTPSLLFEDVTVRRPTGNIPRPPVAPHPLASAR